MRVAFKTLLALLLVGWLLVPTRATPLPQPHDPSIQRASVTVEQGWVRLTLVGSPYEMGLQQGTLLRPALRDLLATALYPSLHAAGLSVRDAQGYGRLVASTLPAPLREEMEGIAAGAGVALEDVLLWNLRPDLLALGPDLPLLVRDRMPLAWSRPVLAPAPPGRGSATERQPWPAPLPPVAPVPPAESAALAVWGDATFDGQTWLAGTLAAPPEGAQFLLVLRHPKGGQPVVGVALPGEVGLRAGLNAAGVGLVAIPFATADRRAAGLPSFLLLRKALEGARSGEETAQTLMDTPRTGGTLFLLAEGNALPQRLALSARQTQRTGDPQPWLVAAGAPVEGPLAASAALMQGEEGAARGRIAGWLHANDGFITPDTLRNLLAEPDIHGRRGGATLLWQPGTSDLWLAQAAEGKPAPASGWVAFDMTAWWLAP